MTTGTGASEYDTAGLLDIELKHTGEVYDGPAERVLWHGNVLGSTQFKTKRVGAVIGSNHYGDSYIKKWGAYAGETVERGDGKGADLGYGRFGNQVLTHMREHDTLQAAMRFGRDGNGAAVYIHTDTLPEWVPVAGEGRVLKTWSDGMRGVIQALECLESPTTAEIVDHPRVDISRQQAFDHLETLRHKDVLKRSQDPDDGRRYVWFDDGLHRLGEHGDAELPTTEIKELNEEDVRKLSRTTIYTSQLTKVAPTEQNKTSPEETSVRSDTIPKKARGRPHRTGITNREYGIRDGE